MKAMSVVSLRRSRRILAVAIVAAVAFACLAWTVKHQTTNDPVEPSMKATLYYRGFGLVDGNSWLGKRKLRLVSDVFPSGQVRGEYLYDNKGMVNTGVEYYASGRTEWISPLIQDQDGTIHDDGVWKSFYEDGKLEREEGRRVGGD